MARPYSMDLRQRVITAIERDGMSRHQAAAHFGIAVSTAVTWVKRFRQTGSIAPGQIGGYKPKKIRGAHRDWLIERCKTGDFTLRGLAAELAERGLAVGYRAVWTFVRAERLSFKKNRARSRARPSRCGATACAMAAIPGAD
jgi:putative transposase